MMDWTDRHCRYFLRRLNSDVRLYTEMITAAALVHGDAGALLEFDETEHPVALQIGGGDPKLMSKAARLGADAGYDEININVGCPSDRVQSGAFGACLMAEPARVADCVSAMRATSSVPVTVKTRIGIDDEDSVEFLYRFVTAITEAGCDHVVVHARKAILEGLSPKENRSVPPLCYPRVYGLKDDFPDLHVVVNGGISSIDDCRRHLSRVDGVMIGRQAYQQPWLLAELKALEDGIERQREDIVREMLPYIERELARGTPLNRMSRHMLGLFAGRPGARAWRRTLSEHAHRADAGPEVLIRALEQLPVAA